MDMQSADFAAADMSPQEFVAVAVDAPAATVVTARRELKRQKNDLAAGALSALHFLR